VIAQTAKHLTVFQRTPQYTLPADHHPISAKLRNDVVSNYKEIRKWNRTSFMGFGGTMATVKPTETLNSAVPAFAPGQTQETKLTAFEKRVAGIGAVKILDLTWEERLKRLEEDGLQAFFSFTDTSTDLEANQAACDLFAEHLRRTVTDPETAAKLTPKDQPFGCKRQVIDSDYYKTYNRPNVSLVDLRRGGIESITPTGIRTSQGEFELDMLIFATGFDAMTGPLKAMNLVGVGGARIQDAWDAGPRTYLGLSVSGFPNLFTVTGPGSPSVLSSMVVSIEQHVEWICSLIGHMRKEGRKSVQATKAAQDKWVDYVMELGQKDVVKTHKNCNSWYLGANIPGKPRVFMPYIGGLGQYRKECDDVAQNGYTGFEFH